MLSLRGGGAMPAPGQREAQRGRRRKENDWGIDLVDCRKGAVTGGSNRVTAKSAVPQIRSTTELGVPSSVVLRI